jgi:membrane-bound lytic murein transglycosylase F
MQVMPGTGQRFGIDITSSTANNVKAGISYIRWLQSLYESKVADENERIKFILASYNAGQGHVLDAIRLAGKNGMDPQRWNGSVEVWIQKKAEPQYYKDPVVKSGYFKGKETVNYVSEVLERYEHYKNIIPEEPKLNLTWNSRRAYVSIDSLVFID